ncbi:hypothetical protein MUK71_12150 [Arthrobacter zhangbolii]|uniref:Histone acetyltransferase Rv0428c-like SH3 domain-containing protein n=1 Tax=Arthrobacter zhangbolii TaxID=2886936 RepID=A0A9X1M8I4_9MICC|nr:hypothetical protein [Arthrobacter zhangbolii]MCC3272822.1 hypothetical protein [Arthrobacter zhangbolii]MCC3294918.1 hypothetical protein [Arthrobacter zhangbolii]UON91345.1 hypothetical protein MUK71_12150 [Arthrobacter zhangbolii]
MNPEHPADLLQRLAPGERVVVRYRIEGGFTDALGVLLRAGSGDCTVSTRRGDVLIPYPLITAAKPVPPAPPRRERKFPA